MVLHMHTVWKNETFTVTEKLRQINYLVISLEITVTFTKFLPKICVSKFP